MRDEFAGGSCIGDEFSNPNLDFRIQKSSISVNPREVTTEVDSFVVKYPVGE